MITPKFLDILEETRPGKGGAIRMTDALRVITHQGNVYACNFQEKRYDTGDKMGYPKAVVELSIRRNDLSPKFWNSTLSCYVVLQLGGVQNSQHSLCVVIYGRYLYNIDMRKSTIPQKSRFLKSPCF